jgi:ribonuclease P protein component
VAVALSSLRAVPKGAPVSPYSVTGLGFNSRYKIKKTDEFSSVFNFRKRISGDHISMHYMPNGLDYSRIGLIVGKKTARRAVQRNYMKRVLRELFRQHRHLLNGIDILMRVQKPFVRIDHERIRIEFLGLLDRLRKRTHRPGGAK